MKALLPVGSVVLLKDATKKLMIIGVLQVNTQKDRLYDYLGVPYPEGYLGEDNNFLFDHEDINDIIFTGYTNPEREAFINTMEILYDRNILGTTETKEGSEAVSPQRIKTVEQAERRS